MCQTIIIYYNMEEEQKHIKEEIVEKKDEGYESIKAGLIQNQFVEDGENFVKSRYNQNMMIINGQRMVQNTEIREVIKYLGKGSIENADGSNLEELNGFEIWSEANGQSRNDETILWVRDWDDFVKTMNPQIRSEYII